MNGIKAVEKRTPHPLSQAKSKGGAPKGNRNAVKTGGFTAAVRAERKEFRGWMKAAGTFADLVCALVDARRGNRAAPKRRAS